ncbi:MAG: alkaline phosphatase family protein, partial [Bryobacteraceae bacterium]
DAEIVAQARSDIRSGEAAFFFLYLSEMDNFLHHHCKDKQAVSERLAWYERQLQDVLSAAKQEDPEATFTIISDHGMTPVRSHYDLVSKIEALGLRMPQDYLSVYDSTMARFWFFNDAARRAVTAELERTPCGRILADAELEGLGILFPDRRFGEIVFLLEPGCLFAKSDFNGSGWNPIGMHGYHPSDPYSDAIFLSNKDPRRQMTNIADIYPCLEEAALSR